MRRPILLALLTLGLAVGAAGPAAAGPADWLCTPSTARGGVPADFLLDACADKTGVTVRNSLDMPVVVKARGAVGDPVRISSDGRDAGEVVRRLDVEGVVLVPGDVVRWPIGHKAAAFDVVDLHPATAPAIVAVLDEYLPRQGAQRASAETLQAFADLVPDLAAAVQEHTKCTDVDELNFLGVTGCDVATATAIGHALDVHLTSGVASDLAPVVLDPDKWADWAAVEVPEVEDIPGRTATLPQHGVPPATPPAGADSPAGPARRPPGRPAPRPAPAPVPAPPRVPAPPAAPAPAPRPAPPPVPPQRGDDHHHDRPGHGRGHDDDRHHLDRWIPLIEQWLEDRSRD